MFGFKSKEQKQFEEFVASMEHIKSLEEALVTFADCVREGYGMETSIREEVGAWISRSRRIIKERR